MVKFQTSEVGGARRRPFPHLPTCRKIGEKKPLARRWSTLQISLLRQVRKALGMTSTTVDLATTFTSRTRASRLSVLRPSSARLVRSTTSPSRARRPPLTSPGDSPARARSSLRSISATTAAALTSTKRRRVDGDIRGHRALDRTSPRVGILPTQASSKTGVRIDRLGAQNQPDPPLVGGASRSL